MKFYNISRENTDLIKGVFIIFVVLHNFIHWTNDIGENELNLDPNRVFVYFNAIKQDPTMFFNATFTFAVIFILQPFMFISGYGMSKQYSKNSSVNYWKYLIPKLLKSYSLVVLGLICSFFLFFNETSLWEFLEFSASVLSMTNNFSYKTIFIAAYGPWWYFSLIIQFILIFPLLYKLIDRCNKKEFTLLIISSLALLYILFPLTEKWLFPLFGNAIGHLSVFMLGIGFARFPDWKLNNKILLPACIIYILSFFYEAFFPLHFITSMIILLFLFPYMFTMNLFIRKKLIYIGSISMFMFIINGPIRPFTIPYLSDSEIPLYTLAGSFIHLIIVIAASAFLSYVYNYTFAPPYQANTQENKNVLIIIASTSTKVKSLFKFCSSNKL